MFLSLACFPRDLPSRARVRSGTSQAGVNPISTSANESDDHAFLASRSNGRSMIGISPSRSADSRRRPCLAKTIAAAGRLW